jgi:aldehyde:ferredoxin oxidoreductase
MIKRFNAFCITVTVLLIILTGCAQMKRIPPDRARSKSKRPSFLFCVADDVSYLHMGSNKWIQTPGFDRVANEGVLFRQAYTPNAKCAPSRSCILTGRNSWQLEQAANHVPFFPAKFKTYPEVLAEFGYFTGFTGKGWAPGDPGKIDGETLKEKYFVKDRGCSQCPLKCGNIHSVKDGPYKLEDIEGPEYETLMSFGSNCGNSNIESILMANYLCNDLGLDTISCGDTFALLMDLFELGMIKETDLDGYSMNWGEHENIVALIPRIANRQGVGDLLAEGSYRAAATWGEKALARVIHAKKQEYPGYESRRSFGTGFSLITSNRGACHLRAALYVNELFLGEFNESGFESNMQTLLDKEHLLCLYDAFLSCKFGGRNAGHTAPVLTELMNALTGFDYTEQELSQVGERIWNLERLYNLREGVEEDLPPVRFYQEALDDGYQDGEAITLERFIAARAQYYQTRGWDVNGIPSADKLTQLRL